MTLKKDPDFAEKLTFNLKNGMRNLVNVKSESLQFCRKYRRSHFEKSVLRTSAKFAKKHLFQSLFFNKAAVVMFEIKRYKGVVF